MYVDKHLGGVQCVQTLSRLNRKISGKDSTFVLDFVNNPEDIKESFQRFFTSTILEGETDPNSLYDTQREIYEFHLYTEEDVDRFCKVFFDPKRDEGTLHPILDQIVGRFNNIEDVEQQEDFRSKLQKYIRMYGYLSQIIKFEDIKLEKSFVFLKYLSKKLPKREHGGLDISDNIDIESLRIQKTYEKIEGLIDEESIVTPPDFESGQVTEPEIGLLSEIINQVNNTYGVNLTEEDKIDLSHLSTRLIESAEITKYMNGENSEDNKKTFFKQQFDNLMIDYVNDRFEFYKRMEENQAMKNTIFQMMYADYQKQQSVLT
jgi:type I restriction enzyme R subunit